MGSGADTAWWYQLDMRKPDAPHLLRWGAHSPAACRKTPLYNARAWEDPPGWRVRVPNTLIPVDDFTDLLDVLGPVTSRLGIWVVEVVSDGIGLPLPTLEVIVSTGAGIGSSNSLPGVFTTAKGLSSLVDDPFFFELKGDSASEWQLRARIQAGLGARPITVGFGLLSSQSKCCSQTVIGH